jgi:DNA polymerase-3 subunit beta
VKFTVETRAFRQAIDAVKYATGSKLKDALKGIYCEVQPGEITLQATDLEIGIVYRMTPFGSVAASGACILPTEQIAKLLRETNASHVNFDLKDATLHVYAGDLHCELTTENANEFPQVQLPTGGQWPYGVKMSALMDGFGKVGFAVGQESARFAVSGVLVDIRVNAMCTLVATDTAMLATASFATERDVGCDEFKCIVPVRAFKLLQAVSTQGGIVGISKVGNDLIFATESVTVSTRTIEGKFPPYQDIIPKRHETTAELQADEFAAVLRAVAVTSETGRVDLEFSWPVNVLRLESKSVGGRATTQTACSVSGPTVKVALAIDKLLPFLATCKGQMLKILLIDKARPVVIIPGDGRTFLLMPMAD